MYIPYFEYISFVSLGCYRSFGQCHIEECFFIMGPKKGLSGELAIMPLEPIRGSRGQLGHSPSIVTTHIQKGHCRSRHKKPLSRCKILWLLGKEMETAHGSINTAETRILPLECIQWTILYVGASPASNIS